MDFILVYFSYYLSSLQLDEDWAYLYNWMKQKKQHNNEHIWVSPTSYPLWNLKSHLEEDIKMSMTPQRRSSISTQSNHSSNAFVFEK